MLGYLRNGEDQNTYDQLLHAEDTVLQHHMEKVILQQMDMVSDSQLLIFLRSLTVEKNAEINPKGNVLLVYLPSTKTYKQHQQQRHLKLPRSTSFFRT